MKRLLKSWILPERWSFLLRGHWLGRLLILGLLSLGFAELAALLFAVQVWNTHLFMGLISASLILSPLFGLGRGGLLGLRLGLSNVRLIVGAMLAVATTGLLVMLFWKLLGPFQLSMMPSNQMHIIDFPTFDIFLFVLVAAAGEEFLVRGLPFSILVERFGESAGIGLSSLVFVLIHFVYHNPSPIATLNLALFGLIMAAIVIRSGSLWIPLVYHVLWNLHAAFMQGWPVGGSRLSGAMADTYWAAYPAWISWFVGTFDEGPEGGLLMTFMLLAIGVWLLPRLEQWRDPVLRARNFKRKLLSSELRDRYNIRF